MSWLYIFLINLLVPCFLDSHLLAEFERGLLFLLPSQSDPCFFWLYLFTSNGKNPRGYIHRVLALSAFDILLNKYFPAG
jgi:hypothetical protein